MKWFSRLSALMFGLLTLRVAKDLLERNRILVINDEYEDDEEDAPKNIVDLKPKNYDKSMDLRGTPTHICPCGCNIFNVKVIFDNFEIATYFLDMECSSCGSLATAPTPIDTKGEY